MATDEMDSRHGGFRNFDARPLEIFFESRIELVQSAELEVGHALFLRLPGISCSYLVRSGHGVGCLQLRCRYSNDSFDNG
jgi:hypothetical protein